MLQACFVIVNASDFRVATRTLQAFKIAAVQHAGAALKSNLHALPTRVVHPMAFCAHAML
jgi:hypothetical protein